MRAASRDIAREVILAASAAPTQAVFGVPSRGAICADCLSLRRSMADG